MRLRVVGLYEQLEKRDIHSVEALEHWLIHRSELDAALSQAGSILYIQMTCQTDDPKWPRRIPVLLKPFRPQSSRSMTVSTINMSKPANFSFGCQALSSL